MFNYLAQKFVLGVEAMDLKHEEFLALLSKLNGCENSFFVENFEILLQHTKEHFDGESQLMDNSGYKGAAEHKGEHEKLLFEMGSFFDKARSGRTAFAKSYASQRLPEWFELHARTMDSDLAAHLLKK